VATAEETWAVVAYLWFRTGAKAQDCQIDRLLGRARTPASLESQYEETDMDLKTTITMLANTTSAGVVGSGTVLGYVAHADPVLLATVPAGILAFSLSSALARAIAQVIMRALPTLALRRLLGIDDSKEAVPDSE
jgi:hypothetical protein